MNQSELYFSHLPSEIFQIVIIHTRPNDLPALYKVSKIECDRALPNYYWLQLYQFHKIPDIPNILDRKDMIDEYSNKYELLPIVEECIDYCRLKPSLGKMCKVFSFNMKHSTFRRITGVENHERSPDLYYTYRISCTISGNKWALSTKIIHMSLSTPLDCNESTYGRSVETAKAVFDIHSLFLKLLYYHYYVNSINLKLKELTTDEYF